MRTNFPIKIIEQTCTVFNGNSINAKVKREHFTDVSEGYPYIATKDIGFDSVVDYQNGIIIPLSQADKFKKANTGNILICAEGGSAGRKIAFLQNKVCFVNKLFAIEPNNELDNRFFYYWCKSPIFQEYFKNKYFDCYRFQDYNRLAMLVYFIGGEYLEWENPIEKRFIRQPVHYSPNTAIKMSLYGILHRRYTSGPVRSITISRKKPLFWMK